MTLNNGTSVVVAIPENELTKVLSDKQLLDMKTSNPNNQSVANMVDGILLTRSNLAKQAKIEAEFSAKVAKLTKLPAPPDGIHNLYLNWSIVEIPQDIPEGCSEAKQKELEANPIKTWQWVITTNKGFTQGKATSTESGTSKRAITVHSRNGTSLVFVGNFRTGAEACEYLKLSTNGDSAPRVLKANGYIVDAYTGNDFIVKA
jgi:hypothetical protein